MSANPNDFDYFKAGESLPDLKAATTSGFDVYKGGEPFPSIVQTNTEVSPTGISATGSVGTPSVSADSNIDPTGQSATGDIGDVTVTVPPPVPPTPQPGMGGYATFRPSNYSIPSKPPEPKKPTRKITPYKKAKVDFKPVITKKVEKAELPPEPEPINVTVNVKGLSFRMHKPKTIPSFEIDAGPVLRGTIMQSHFGRVSIKVVNPPTGFEIAEQIREEMEAVSLSRLFTEDDEEESVPSVEQQIRKQEIELQIEEAKRPMPIKRHVTVLRGRDGAISGLEIEEIYA